MGLSENAEADAKTRPRNIPNFTIYGNCDWLLQSRTESYLLCLKNDKVDNTKSQLKQYTANSIGFLLKQKKRIEKLIKTKIK